MLLKIGRIIWVEVRYGLTVGWLDQVRMWNDLIVGLLDRNGRWINV